MGAKIVWNAIFSMISNRNRSYYRSTTIDSVCVVIKRIDKIIDNETIINESETYEGNGEMEVSIDNVIKWKLISNRLSTDLSAYT